MAETRLTNIVGFNVASVQRPRKSVAPVVPAVVHSASMWPRSKDRGNFEKFALHHLPRRASMWPRSKDRGNGLC